MKEAEFLGEIFRICSENLVKNHHCGNARTCLGDRGLPDLILLGSHHLCFAELKQHSMDSRTPEQTDWYYGLLASGTPCYLWTPKDLPEIEKIIEGLNEK